MNGRHLIAGLLYTVILTPLLAACAGPGHQALERQLAVAQDTPVLSVQGYRVQSAEAQRELRRQWHALARIMRGQPGFIGARLSPGANGSVLWLAQSKWVSAQALRTAFSQEEVLQGEAKMPKRSFGHLFALGEFVESRDVGHHEKTP